MTVHVHQDGLLDLGFVLLQDGRTVIGRRRQRFPLRTTVATYPDDADPKMPWVIVQNPTGGTFPGDRLELCFDLAPMARAHVRNQSATKLYAGDGEPAFQRVAVRAGAGAVGEYLGDVLIPHAGSCFSQVLEISAARSSRVIAADTVAAGRVAHGELFAFESLRLSTVVEVDGALVHRDVLALEPGRRSPSSHGAFGGLTHLSTVIAVCPDADVEALAASVDASLGERAGHLAGASVLPYEAGVLVRSLAGSASEARKVVALAWAALRRELVGHPPPGRLI